MNDCLETIIKRMKDSNHSEAILVAEFADDLLSYRESNETDDDVAQHINDSMDEIIAAAKIIKAWAKGVPIS